ncbi:MAG: DUF362 domain-containing protein [Planctomycetes bacterium]|nr:DUF362 domain-containing protein [Planctomycetota bacterium]
MSDAEKQPDSSKLILPPASERVDRRALIVGGGAAAAGLLGVAWWRGKLHRIFGGSTQAGVFVARNQRYDGPLEQTIRDGLIASGIVAETMRGLRVLLKPNMVEPMRLSPQMTTHPAMVVAVANVFRGWGAEVRVGEAPGHVRDTEMALEESRLGEALDDGKIEFADLNYQDVRWAHNAGRRSVLKGFYFPQAVVEADLVVSMPKLKTHHWMGMTAALKNMYGSLPGCKYGWPKNVLHHAGIPETVIDINASLPRTITVVDGITCMEGDGPILGSAKQMGLVVVGTNLTAVDATCARIIGLAPQRIPYLQLAGGVLGPLADHQIRQLGEPWQSVASPFEILDAPHLRSMRPSIFTS